MYFLEEDHMGVSKIPGGLADTCAISQNLGPKVYLLPLGACGAKRRTQQNKHLVSVNTSGDVLVKIVEKVRHTLCIQGAVLGLH